MLKDSKGFMWFGTNEGLNKYDGYKFSIYKHYPADKNSISNNGIYDLLEDKTGNIWVATGDGLDVFDRGKDVFTHYFKPDHQFIIHDIFQDTKQRLWLGTTTGLYRVNPDKGTLTGYKAAKSSTGLSNDFIMKITQDQRGLLWIATQNGLHRFDPDHEQFEPFVSNPAEVGSGWVRALLVDRRQDLWIGTLGGGLSKFNASTKSFITYRHRPGDPHSLSHNDVMSLLEDASGNIWVGTENGGISIYQPPANTFTTLTFDPADAHSLSNNSIYSLYEDNIGNIWVGTYSGGVNFLPKFGQKFNLYRHKPDENSLSNTIILSIKGDADDVIWLGTDGGGLNRLDRRTGQFSVFRNQLSTPNSPASDYIITVVEVEKNVLALGYHRAGFDLFDTKRQLFTHYRPLKGNENDLPTSSVNVLFSDKNSDLWIGTWARGLYFYDRRSKRVTRYLHKENDPNTLCNNYLSGIYEDSEGLIWLATENGLDALDRRTGRFTHYKHNPKNGKTISSNTVNAILGAGPDHLWVGTAGGLCLLNKKTGQSEAITEKDGLPNSVINALISDKQGNVWISTNKGICRYNPRTKSIRTFGILDGLQGNEFKVGSIFKASDGMIFVGGTDGLNTFYPDRIRDNTYVPPVYITDFQIFNKSVRIGDADSVLTKHISETGAISIRYDQNVFTVEFAALNYTLPEKNQYAYKLDGFDENWNYVGTKRSATYTNLDPGTYTFRVRGSNNDGVWNEKGTSVLLTVLPPYWQTWWFKLLVTSTILGSVYAFYKARIHVIESQKWALERILEERTERLHQEQILNKMKSQFVSTASHEFRTPLATIQSSVDLVGMYIDLPAERGKPQIQKHLQVVEKEISKFGTLLDDILTIEKMNAGKLLFSPRSASILTICNDVISTYFHQRTITITTSGVPCLLLLDEKLVSQILVNLLSNAFKFSTTDPALHIEFGEKKLSVSIMDQGIGIPQKDLPHLFESFYRASNVATIQGTGLGLFITKQAVELHGGSIQVQSQENVGTTFTIQLPAVPFYEQVN